MRLLLSLTSAIVLTALLASAIAPAPDHLQFRAVLSGDAEVPAVETDTRGTFKIRFAEDYSSAEFQVNLRNAERITQAHIHFAAEGENGPVMLFLTGFHDRGWDIPSGPYARATLTNDNIISTDGGATLEEIADTFRAGNAYVNVHSLANPGGEVRGQIRD